MLYIEFEVYKNKYYEAQKKYDAILSEKEILFNKTQPKATNYSAEKVRGGETNNSFDIYLIAKDEKLIDERLDEIKAILEDRKDLLKMKEEELRESKNVHDRIYVCRYLDRIKVRRIARIVSYSEIQIYRILKQIEKNVKMIVNDKK